MLKQYDDFSRTPVSGQGANRSWFWLFMVDVGVMLCLPILVLGGLVANSLPFPAALLAIGLSCVILTLVGIVMCVIGVQTRLTTALIAQQTLGTVSAKVVAVVVLISYLGWWGFQTEIMAQTFSAILVNEGWSLPRWLTVGVCGAVMISTSVLGSNAIGKVAYVLVPIKLVALMVLLAYFKGDTTLAQIWSFVPTTPLSFGQVVGILVGGVIVGLISYPDMARFLRTTRDATLAPIGIFLAMALIYAVAAFISVAYHTPNIVEILPTLGFAPLALLLVFFATWAANDKNLYAACLGIAGFTTRLNRGQITLLAGALGVLLAYIGIFNHLVTVLTLLGIVTSPLAPIYIYQHFWGNPAKAPSSKGAIPTQIPTQWPTILAWAGGGFVGWLTTPIANFGWGLFSLTTAPAIDAFLAAALLMLLSPQLKKILS